LEVRRYFRQIDTLALGQICLVEDDHRARATLLRDHEIALNPPGIQVAIKPAYDEQNIDVRREDLFIDRTSGPLARENCLPFEHVVDDGRTGSQCHPVTDCGPSRAVSPELAAYPCLQFTLCCPHHKSFASCRRYASGHAIGQTRARLAREKAIP